MEAMRNKPDLSLMFTPAEAERLARELARNEDDGWTFVVELTPGGVGAKVKLLDENGEFVAYW